MFVPLFFVDWYERERNETFAHCEGKSNCLEIARELRTISCMHACKVEITSATPDRNDYYDSVVCA